MAQASSKSGWAAQSAAFALSSCLCVAGTLFAIVAAANYLRATLWLQLDAESALLLKEYGPPPVHPFVEVLVGIALAATIARIESAVAQAHDHDHSHEMVHPAAPDAHDHSHDGHDHSDPNHKH